MIDREQPTVIRFSEDDQPDLPEISEAEAEARREAERQKKEATVRRLEKHCRWHPHGNVW